MRSVVLSGFMGTGKSTLGPLLAERLGAPFVDTDDEIAREAGMAIADLWRQRGEGHFRALEAQLAERLLTDTTPRVIALGGGAMMRRATRHLALDRAFVVTLRADPATILARVGDASTRPNLASTEPRARVEELLALRADAYAECHTSLATDALAPEDAVTRVIDALTRDPLLVPLGRRSYAVDVAIDTHARLTDALAALAPSQVIVVTDANVQRARGRALDASLAPLGVRCTRVTLAPGEEHKTLASVGTIWDLALGAGVDRDAVVLGFGGGVVGDLAGFAAATLLRGVRVVLAPTTLLAMVDASVGGKTGFDHPVGKNLIGAFHQPRAVVADLAHLATLPPRDLRAGLAEVVKVALVADAALLEALEQDAVALARGDAGALAAVIRRAVIAKARVVRDDELEGGRRALLNLGHTIGHALEAHAGYTQYRHGEAVALGIIEELRIAAKVAGTPAALTERVRGLLARLGLPVDVSREELRAAWPFVSSDKKRRGATVAMPIVSAPGEAEVTRIPFDAIGSAVIERA
jgi:shikimate kinase/3-dehydroquinate synthase